MELGLSRLGKIQRLEVPILMELLRWVVSNLPCRKAARLDGFPIELGGEIRGDQ